MTIRRARPKDAAQHLALVVLLGAWSGAAVAAADISDPCPASAEHAVSDFHDMLVDDTMIAPVADTETEPANDAAEEEADVAVEDAQIEMPKLQYTTRLPGVSASDMPRFRRHMFRTDI